MSVLFNGGATVELEGQKALRKGCLANDTPAPATRLARTSPFATQRPITMHADDPTNATESTESPANTAPAAPAAPVADDPETVRALARDTLAWCRENPGDPGALPRLNTVLELVHDPVLAKEVLAAGEAVTRHAIGDEAPRPATHAHMTVLMALLLEYEPTRDGVDALFVEWLKHPRSYGPAHATPPNFQREAFVQRLGDLLGWGSLDVRADRDALTRFAQWVDGWTPKNKFRAKRAIDAVRRNFPAPDVWSAIRFPQNDAPRHHNEGGGGGHNRGGGGPQRGGGNNPNRDQGRREGKKPAAPDAAPVTATAPEAAPATTPEAAPEAATGGDDAKR